MTEQTAIQERAAQQAELQQTEPTINLPMLMQPEEANMIIQENLEGMGDMKFDKINMPSGGGIAFTVVDEDGKETPLTA